MRVLIADDEKLESDAIELILRQYVETAELVGVACNGEEAVWMDEKLSPEVIFIDVIMPVLPGLDAAELIKKRNPQRKIVMMSGYDRFELVQRAMQIKAEDYLLKPIKPELIVALMGRLQRQQNEEHIQAACLALRIELEKECYEKAREIVRDTFTFLKKLQEEENKDYANAIVQLLSAYCGSFSLPENCHLKRLEPVLLERLEKQEEEYWGRESANRKGLLSIINYIEQHYMENITLLEAAETVNFSSNYLSKLFKKEIGTNFNKYITKKRIQEAKKRLMDTNSTINDIAFDVGYHEPNYFCNVFKKLEGITPSQYRETMQNTPNEDKKL